MQETTAIVILAKAPVPGLAKTRLVPALGEQGAAELAARLLRRTLQAALEADVGPVELCVTPALVDVGWQRVTIPPTVLTSDQGDGDLGARLERAAQRWLTKNTPVLLIGTDCVEMSGSLLQAAAADLHAADAVLYPARDGGYVLLGLRRFNQSLFRAIPWSTDEVCARTLQRLQALGWSTILGRTFHDLDDPEDLALAPELIPDYCRSHTDS